MDISKQMHHDHAELRSLSEDILKASDGGDVGGRDNQFDLYDMQVRRHLAVIEEVLLPLCKKDASAQDSAADIHAQHKRLRKELSHLDRSGKGSHEWTAEFRTVADEFEALARRHEALLHHAERIAGDRTRLTDQYEQAKIRRMRGGPWSWGRMNGGGTIGTAAVALGAVAAVAGAAYAANRYMRNGQRSDDFELRLETDENLRLISSAKVEGTPVVDRDGTRIGKIESFMVDKYTGRVAYAIMSFGGTMGFGASLFPLPWPVLEYDEEAAGYMLDIAKEDMANAPRFEASNEPEFSPEYRREIMVFYRPVSSGTYASASSPDSWSASTDRQTAGAGSTGASTNEENRPTANAEPARLG